MPRYSRSRSALEPDRLGAHLFLRERGRLAEADDQRHRERARTHAALVTATVDDRIDADARLAAHPQRTDALGAVHLVRRDRDEVGLRRFDVERNLAGALHGVDVEQRLRVLRLDRRADRVDVLDDADLVVREHDADDDRLVGHRGRHHLGRDDAVLLRGEVRDLAAFALEALARVDDALVLGLDGDDVVALLLVGSSRRP